MSSFTAQSCEPLLAAPMNGNIVCANGQVTDQSCSFSCNPGYSLLGSETRDCLANNSFSGVASSCVAKHCIPLADSTNSFVDIQSPCGTVLSSACEIKCLEGYYMTGNAPFHQTCVANQTSGDVYWTDPPTCRCEPM